MTKKILYFGGSFDPAHKGHAALLAAAVKHLRPHATHIVPTFHSPFKEKPAAPFNLRMQMARALFKNTTPGIIFDNFEQKQNRKTYAWEVVKYLKTKYPGAQIYLLTGADSAATVPQWKNAKYLLANTTVVYGKRKGCAWQKLPFKHIELKAALPKVSSTEIRLQTLLSGKPAKQAEKAVAQAIIKNNLYGLNIHKWLKKNLKESRYLHSLGVAKAALELAQRFGADAQSALTAALLHDAAKCMSPQQMLKYTKKYNIKPPYYNELAAYAPTLLHSYISEDIAKKIFKINDAAILQAIAAHTLGAQDMALLSKIIFTADIASGDRPQKDAAPVRAAAKKSINAATLAAAEVKLTFSFKTRKWICPQGILVWNELVKQNS